MKQWGLIFILIIICSCNMTPQKVEEQKLSILMWEDEFSPELLNEFSEQYNVNITTYEFTTNEEMAEILRREKIDIFTVDDANYEVVEGKESRINYEQVPNIRNLDIKFTNAVFDTHLDYYVPFEYGTICIAYDSNAIKRPITSWKDMMKKEYKGKIGILEYYREAVIQLLKQNNYSINTQSETELEKIKKQANQFKHQIGMIAPYTELQDALADGRIAMTMAYSGDIIKYAKENKLDNIECMNPVEGTNYWVETLGIKNDSENKKTAHKFINFMLVPENSRKQVEYNLYPSTIRKELQKGWETELDDTTIKGEYEQIAPLKEFDKKYQEICELLK